MQSDGIRRKVDDLGRIVLPAPFRRALGIGEGDELVVTLEGDRLVLCTPGERCAFCGEEDEDAATFRGKAVCPSCRAAIRALDREEEAAPRRSPFG